MDQEEAEEDMDFTMEDIDQMIAESPGDTEPLYFQPHSAVTNNRGPQRSTQHQVRIEDKKECDTETMMLSNQRFVREDNNRNNA